MALVEPKGCTVQLAVPTGEGTAAREWYETLFGRPPDFRPFDDDTFLEWQFRPGYWEVHVVEVDDPTQRDPPFRFGIEDIDAVSDSLADNGVEVSEGGELSDVVRWYNFEDPWGNSLGLYQDLSRFG